MTRTKIGIPDGNGALGGYEFWTDFCNIIKIELIDVPYDLRNLQEISNTYFPKNICLASKYRLGRAILLAPLVDYLIFFLFDDKYVFNCPNSIYRIKWIKAYIESHNLSTKVIVWPFDLTDNTDIQYKFIEITKILNGDISQIQILNSKYKCLPQKALKYEFQYKKDRKNILLVGKIPFIVDPFRKTEFMDRLTSQFGVLLPHLINDNDTSYELEKGSNVIFYKEKSIISAFEKAFSLYTIHGVVFAADIFDIPGNYTFPVLKNYLKKIGINYIHIKLTLNSSKSKIDSIIKLIDNMNVE